MKRTVLSGVLTAVLLLLIVPVIIYFAFPEALVSLANDMERRAAGLSQKSITVGSHDIAYLEGGEGEAILLLHGFSADKGNWTRFSKYLTPEFHVVAIDLPGFGESTKNEAESYTIADQVKRVDSIVKSLGLEKFHLAGNSMGGSISGKYTASFPGKVMSLGLFNSGGVQACPEQSEFLRRLEKGENALLVENPEDFDRVLEFVFVKPPWIPRPIKTYLARQAVSSREFNDKIFREIREENYDMRSELPKIKVETLILWGDTDRLIDVSCTKVLEEGLPNSTTVIMKNCGHIPMIERPEEAAGHYLAFLKS